MLQIFKNKAVGWIVVVALVVTGGGATLGNNLIGKVSTTVPVGVSQAVLIDGSTFSKDDIGIAAKRKSVTISDDWTAATIAAELATGDTMVFDLPLVNMSENDAHAVLEIDAPEPLNIDVTSFWSTFQRTSAPAVQITTPTPTPFTTTYPQNADTTATTDLITGVVPIGEQVSNSHATLSSPGLAPVTAQVKNTSEVNIHPDDSAGITPQVITRPSGAKPAGAWQSGSTAVDTPNDVGIDNSIAYGDQDRIFISYYDNTGGNLKFARTLNGGTTWTNKTIDSSGDVGQYSSIAVVESGDYFTIFVSYYDASGEKLMFAKSINSGENWTTKEVDSSIISDVGKHTSIAAFNEDDIVITYREEGVMSETIKAARSNDGGGSWSTSTVTSFIDAIVYSEELIGGPAMAVAGDDTVYVGYGWKSKTIIIVPWPSPPFFKKFDINQRFLNVRKSTDGGASWGGASSVDYAFGIKPPIYLLPTIGEYLSLTAVDTNTVFMSYSKTHPYLVPATTGLKFARTTDGGNSWDDSDVFWDLHNLGDYNSIAAVDASNIFISAYDSTDDELALFTSTNGGSSWTESTPDSGNVGKYTSVAALRTSTLFTFISYYDYNSNNLKFYGRTNGSQIYYPGQFILDLDADGALDSLDAVLTDLDNDNDIDRIDLSHSGNFGENDLHNKLTGSGDDERFDAGRRASTAVSEDIRLGTYLFTTEFLRALAGGQATASITSKSWFLNDFIIDLDVDAVSDEPAHFVLSDTDSNGLYETMDISGDDITYGEGNLTDQITGDDDDLNDDERIGTDEDVRIGRYYTFNVTFDVNPPWDADDARIEALTHFEGTFDFDIDADGDLTTGPANIVNYGLTDTNSNGLYDTMDISAADTTFGEGGLADGNVVVGNDERIIATAIMMFGPAFSEQVTFDINPPADLSDTRILTLTRYENMTGWTIDATGDEVADNHVIFVLSDTDSNGLLDTIDISTGDEVFGEGVITSNHPPLADGTVDYSDTDNANDERISFSDFPYPLQLGLHYFDITADTAPLTDAEDAHITSKWYFGTFPVDVDNDIDDNAVAFIQVDANSDGLYETFELDGNNDGVFDASEVHSSSDILVDLIGHRMRLHYRLNPNITEAEILNDGRLLVVTRAGTNKWQFIVPADAKPGLEQTQVRIIIDIPPDISPGYYRIKLNLEQVN